jgi:hypothetical protein
MLAVLFNGYLLLGLVNEVRFQLFPASRPAGWFASSEELLASGRTPPATGDATPEQEGKVPQASAPSGENS